MQRRQRCNNAKLFFHVRRSMVIHDFHIFRSTSSPAKANSPLNIDPNRVLAFAVPLEWLKTVSGRNTQRLQRDCCINHSELAARDGEYVCRKPFWAASVENCLGYDVLEASYHGRFFPASPSYLSEIRTGQDAAPDEHRRSPGSRISLRSCGLLARCLQSKCAGVGPAHAKRSRL